MRPNARGPLLFADTNQLKYDTIKWERVVSGSALTSYSEDIHGGGKGSFSIRRNGLITKISELREDEMLGNFQLRIAVALCMAIIGKDTASKTIFQKLYYTKIQMNESSYAGILND